MIQKWLRVITAASFLLGVLVIITISGCGSREASPTLTALPTLTPQPTPTARVPGPDVITCTKPSSVTLIGVISGIYRQGTTADDPFWHFEICDYDVIKAAPTLLGTPKPFSDIIVPTDCLPIAIGGTNIVEPVRFTRPPLIDGNNVIPQGEWVTQPGIVTDDGERYLGKIVVNGFTFEFKDASGKSSCEVLVLHVVNADE